MSDSPHIPFGLQWPGKAEAALNLSERVRRKTPYEPNLSMGCPHAKHRLIEGDNLSVMYALLPEFESRLKMISTSIRPTIRAIPSSTGTDMDAHRAKNVVQTVCLTISGCYLTTTLTG